MVVRQKVHGYAGRFGLGLSRIKDGRLSRKCRLRRLAALFEGWDNPLRRLLMQPDNEDDGRAARNLLGSALAAVEAGEDLRRE